ncbi:MAG: dTDP-4-dehydrorhamnose reductase [Sciscionella sp.]|nr:dTDP-4-dehydrorhamnose reductase [Sciscionella sp.]
MVSDLALLIPGGTGQLGRDLAVAGGEFVRAPGSAALDITDAHAVDDAVDELAGGALARGLRPVVINAAAYTAVDDAESDVDSAFAVNADGARNLAVACARNEVPLIHVSTDYVFAGDASRPYQTDDHAEPTTVYGRSKLAGERAVLDASNTWVVRTAWVYGTRGANFVRTMARLERSRETVTVVDDQRGSPTYSADLAGGLLRLAESIVDGSPAAVSSRLLHCTGGGDTTWFEFARAIFVELGADPDRVKPCRSKDFPRPAPRPRYSVLSDASWRAAGLPPLRHWRAALADAFATAADHFRE